MRGTKAIWIGSGPSVRRSDPGPTTAVRPPSHLALAVESFGSSARRVPLLACPAVRDKAGWCGHDRAWPSIIFWRDALHYLLEGRAALSPGGTRSVASVVAGCHCWLAQQCAIKPVGAATTERGPPLFSGVTPSIIFWLGAPHYLLDGRAAVASSVFRHTGKQPAPIVQTCHGLYNSPVYSKHTYPLVCRWLRK
jgi:hypothetical protein